jgi:phospholipid-transporting ATPase
MLEMLILSILIRNFVPISLLVTLETVKFIQAMIISKDENIRDKTSGQFTSVQSSNLNEELGQVEYIFSDKTGTLTCNEMEYKMLSVDGRSFGEDTSKDVRNFPKVTNVDFKDKNFYEILDNPHHPINPSLWLGFY